VKRLGNIGRSFTSILFYLSAALLTAAAHAQSVSIKLRITDNITEVPISGAIVSLRKSDSSLEILGFSTNGNFSFTHPPTTQLVQLRVEADQYARRAVSLSLTNSHIEQPFKMDREAPFRGYIIAPTGQAASGAQVVLQEKQKRIAQIFSDPKIETYNQLRTDRADNDGSFSIGPDEKAESILIVHDLGLTEIPVIGWTNGTKVQLRAWTPAKGRMLINDVPAANQTIVASNLKFRNGSSPWGIHLQKFETQTDPAGFFFFDRLPPGDVTLEWMIPIGPQSFSYSHGITFPIDPALPNNLKYHLQGRAIRGQAVPDANFDWNAQFVFAHIASPRQAVSEFAPMGFSSYPRSFVANLGEKGKFEATAVPPGDYTLRITAHKQDDSMETILGNFTVPDGPDPIDLGTVTMKKVNE
jgi:hypothetical protein